MSYINRCSTFLKIWIKFKLYIAIIWRKINGLMDLAKCKIFLIFVGSCYIYLIELKGCFFYIWLKKKNPSVFSVQLNYTITLKIIGPIQGILGHIVSIIYANSTFNWWRTVNFWRMLIVYDPWTGRYLYSNTIAVRGTLFVRSRPETIPFTTSKRYWGFTSSRIPYKNKKNQKNRE